MEKQTFAYKRKPLRLAYFDPQNGLREFVNDGQGMRTYSLSGQAFLRAVVERNDEKYKSKPNKSNSEIIPKISKAEERRRSRYGTHYLDQVITKNGEVKTRAEHILDRVNKYSVTAMAKTYNITPTEERANAFHKKRMRDANKSVNEHIQILYPDQEHTIGLANDTGLISPKRSDTLRQFIIEPKTDQISSNVRKKQQEKHERHIFWETQREIILGEISAEFSERSRALKLEENVKEVQQYLTANLFSGASFEKVYAIYKEDTNEVVSIATKKPKEIEKGYFAKEVEHRMREIPITSSESNTQKGEEVIVGHEMAMCEIRNKERESEIRKALRKAEERRIKGKGDFIDIEKDVHDSTGLMFVIKGAMDSHEDQGVGNVVKQVRKVLESGPWGMVTFEDKSNTRNDGSQSEKQKYRRYIVTAEGISTPFEVIFYAQGDYLNSQNELGERQETKKITPSGIETKIKYTGRSHELYKAYQAFDINHILFPSSMPFYNGKRDLRKKASEQIDVLAKEIRDHTRRNRLRIPKKKEITEETFVLSN